MKNADTVDNRDEKEPENVAGEDKKLLSPTEKYEETCIKNLNEESESSDADHENNENERGAKTDDINKAVVRKLFVHSQWLSVQSLYFKGLFFSGMRETYSKEVVMKFYEHELEAHVVLIEAMYRLNVLKIKDYRLIVQVLELANKYDVPIVIKKCKYVLASTAPSLEMCEHILKETEHLTEMDLVYDMLQTFLVKEFTPIEKTWTTMKFIELSKAAVRLLLKSDDLATESENTIFVALMKWVRVHWLELILYNKCDLLDVVRFEFMSVDFLYDVARIDSMAKKMPRFTDYLQKGLAYNGFSDIRKEQLKPKPKKRPTVQLTGPTFSWVIDDKLEEQLSKFRGEHISSDLFWYQGYTMQLNLSYPKNLARCSLYLKVLDLKGEACLHVSLKAKLNVFGSCRHMTKQLYTAGNLSCDEVCLAWTSRIGKGFTIDVWVEIA